MSIQQKCLVVASRFWDESGEKLTPGDSGRSDYASCIELKKKHNFNLTYLIG